MAFTETEQLLINGLMLCGISKGMAVAIYMTLQSEEQMLEMCNYLVANRNAPEMELLDKAREIAGLLETEEEEPEE